MLVAPPCRQALLEHWAVLGPGRLGSLSFKTPAVSMLYKQGAYCPEPKLSRSDGKDNWPALSPQHVASLAGSSEEEVPFRRAFPSYREGAETQRVFSMCIKGYSPHLGPVRWAACAQGQGETHTR